MRRAGAAGVTSSPSSRQTRSGQRTRGANRAGRQKPSASAERGRNSLRKSVGSSHREREPSSAVGCVIAPSFADIFYNNCFKNGILPIALPQSEVDKLMDDAERGANARISIDLEAQEIRGPDGGVIKFEIDQFRKKCLINGWDDISLTLRKENEIASFETTHKTQFPWM